MNLLARIELYRKLKPWMLLEEYRQTAVDFLAGIRRKSPAAAGRELKPMVQLINDWRGP